MRCKVSDLSPETSKEQQHPTRALKELKESPLSHAASLLLTAKVQKKEPKVAEGKELILPVYTI